MLKGVFFDFDGTLAKTEEEYQKNFVTLIEREGYHIQEEDIAFMAGRGTIARAEYLNQKYGYDIDGESMRAEYRRMNEEMFRRLAPVFMFEDVLPCLEECQKRGLLMAVATNTKHELIDFALEKMGIASFFADVLSGQDIGIRKPDPDVYLQLLKMNGLSSDEVIAVEDTPGGVASAKGADIYTVGLTRLIPEEVLCADTHIKTLSELTDIMERY